MHVDYSANDTKVFLQITPFTLLIPSWVRMDDDIEEVTDVNKYGSCEKKRFKNYSPFTVHRSCSIRMVNDVNDERRSNGER